MQEKERWVQINMKKEQLRRNIAIRSSNPIKSETGWECLQKLNELGKKNNVILYWVSGYVSIEGNEKGNSLAKKGPSH